MTTDNIAHVHKPKVEPRPSLWANESAALSAGSDWMRIGRKVFVPTLAILGIAGIGGLLLLRSEASGPSQLISSAHADSLTSAQTEAPLAAAAGTSKVAAITAAPVATAPIPPLQFTDQLRTAGVSKCLNMTQGIGQFTMANVAEYGSNSSWNAKQPDQHLLSAMIGQKFAGTNGAGELHGVSAVMAAPTMDGKCDGAFVQIIPSPLSCDALQTTVMAKGKQLGVLAGIPLLQNASAQRMMLLPTAGNGCVVVGFNNVYAE